MRTRSVQELGKQIGVERHNYALDVDATACVILASLYAAYSSRPTAATTDRRKRLHVRMALCW